MTATQEYFASKLKLWTGMFLMFYCVTHYLNHSMGIFGLNPKDSVSANQTKYTTFICHYRE